MRRRRKAKAPAQPPDDLSYAELYELAESGRMTWLEAARRAGVAYMDRPSDPYRHLRQEAGYELDGSDE